MPHPTDGYAPETLTHWVRVIDLQTDNPLFSYTSQLWLDGRGQGLTTELLDRITQTVADYAAEQLTDVGGTHETRATLSYTGGHSVTLLPAPGA
ncbi:hypothetical protein [Streptomyces sp. Ac-502]|uniref:hypothetical protein n=1 Tax=Streptomyces sp. Ac-502 TaxID=3342801 RepID=UPI0038628E6D